MRILLVVVAIIVILFVVLEMYSYARGVDTHSPRMQTWMQSLATQSSLYLKDTNSYKGFCTSSEALGAPEQVLARGPLPELSELTNNNLTSYTCNDSAQHWAVTIPIGTNKYLCIDDIISDAVGPSWSPGVTLGLEVSQPVGAETSCSNLGELKKIISG